MGQNIRLRPSWRPGRPTVARIKRDFNTRCSEGSAHGAGKQGVCVFVLRVSRMREPCKEKESFANPLFASPVCAPPKFTIEKLRFVRFVPPAIAVPRGRWRSVYIPFTERGRRTLFTGWGEGGGQQFVRNRVSGKVAAIPIPRARISMSNRLFCGGCVPVSATPSPGKVHFSTHTPRIKMGHQTNVVQETAAWLAWDAFRFRPPPAPGRGGGCAPYHFT